VGPAPCCSRIIAPIAATLIQLGISRSREFMADKTGAEIADDPEGLARALEKLAMGTARIAPAMARPATASLYIANPFAGSGRGVLNLFSTHPAMELRIEKLRALPPGSGFSGGEGSSRGGGRSVSARSGGGGARGGFGNPYGT
jgi:heat shock protein HtpX